MSTIGVAIGEESLSTADGWERALPLPTSPAWRAALTDALRALKRAKPAATALRIALLPPLAEIRLTELPPIALSRLRPAVARDAAKYLPVGDTPQTVQVRRVGAGDGGAFAPHLVSAAATTIIETTHAAALDAGFSIDAIVAASSVWATAGARSGNGVPHRALVRALHRAEVFEYADGALRGVRRLAADAAPGDAAVLAPSAREAARLAADARGSLAGDALWPASVERDRVLAAGRRTRLMVGALVVALAFVPVVLWWTARRDEQSAQLARAAIAPQVRAALVLRDSLQRIDATIRSLDGFRATAPQWTRVVADVSDALPGDAWVSDWRTNGDTLTLVGEADHAAAAFSALLKRPTLAEVHTLAPMQQVTDASGAVTERFTVGARARTGATLGLRP